MTRGRKRPGAGPAGIEPKHDPPHTTADRLLRRGWCGWGIDRALSLTYVAMRWRLVNCVWEVWSAGAYDVMSAARQGCDRCRPER